MTYWTDTKGGCACGRGAKVLGDADFAVGSCGPICELCVKEDGYILNPETGTYWQPSAKITSVYQTPVGTRVEFEGDAWTIEDPITCLMDKEGWLFFIATEERGERVAKVAVQVNGMELAPVDLREFPESECTEISGYTLGLVVLALGGWEKIWTVMERLLYPS